MEHGVLAAHGAGHRVGVGDVTEHLGGTSSRTPPALHHGHVVAARDQGRRGAPPSRPEAPVTRTFTRRPHDPSRPASVRAACRATSSRSTLEAWRMSSGSRSARSTAATAVPLPGVPPRPGRARPGAGRARQPSAATAALGGHDHDDEHLGPRRADPDDRRRPDPVELLHPLLDADRGDRAVGRAHHVRRAVPRPTGVPRRRGARRHRCGASRGGALAERSVAHSGS